MANLQLFWLGPPVIQRHGHAIHLETRKATALLAYLSLSPTSRSRESLATLFWPEFDQTHALANLRRALISLNQPLGPDILASNRDSIGIQSNSQVWLDVSEFHLYLEKAKTHTHSQTAACPECLEAWEAAVNLYRGDFLEGLNLRDCPEFDEWQYLQRESLKQELARGLEQLAKGYASEGKTEQAIGHARRWVELDRLNEPAQRMLMSLYNESGQRSAALRQYESMAQMFREEFGLSPEVETVQLYDRIQAEKPLQPPAQSAQGNGPLIKTKLFIPPLRVDRVPRPRLLDLLDAGCQRSLTLISAPAGFGKTTLLAHWTTHTPLPVAWFSLDVVDNDPIRFLSYLIAALDNVVPDFAQQFQGAFQSRHPTIQPILIGLINRLASVSEPFALVLDDYYVIHSPDVHQSLAFLLEKIPPCMHIVVATRADPPLPLARLRARDQLIEIRANDLRFTTDEAADFLISVMSLNLTTEDISTLGIRTEGWIAGLQMAALSMRDREDVSGFIQEFSGTNRFILDYLLEEVLANQPQEIQNFLLYTSILDRLTPPLCDSLLADDENPQDSDKEIVGVYSRKPSPTQSASILEYLERANLFLVPLDDERTWYRYHHLFADLLRARLQQTLKPQDIRVLHVRAAQWYEQKGLAYEAIHHASLAPDNEWVERLIEQNYVQMFQHTERSSFRFLTGKLSKELVYKRPRLCIYEAESSLWFGQLDQADVLLAEAEKHIRAAAPASDTQSMLSHHAYVKSRVTAMRGDIHQAIELGHLARENTPTGNLALQLSIGVLLGYEYFLDGDFANACQTLIETIQSAPASRDVIVATRCVLARLYAVQGLLNQSYGLYQKAAQVIQETGGQHLGAISIINVGIADVLYEWNNLEAALTHVKQGLEVIHYWGKADDIALAYTTHARIQQAQGDIPAALETIEKGSHVIHTSGVFSEARHAVATAEIRLRLAQGDSLAVTRWTSSLEQGLSSGDPLRYENELKHITLARVYLAQKRLDESLGLLSRLEAHARSGGRTGRLIQILILKALAMQKLGQPAQAMAILVNSLTLAEPEGFIRVFVDEGQPMQLLLAQWLAHASPGPLRDYANHLLSTFDAEPNPGSAAQGKASPAGDLVEPLSPRETDVLRLIALGRTNPDIARQLIVSPGTVKAHTASIYRKLDVANRTEAVARARQLGLLP